MSLSSCVSLIIYSAWDVAKVGLTCLLCLFFVRGLVTDFETSNYSRDRGTVRPSHDALSLLPLPPYPSTSRNTQGVAHLTTHRLTFHASLLSSSPDNLSSQIIKAGPVLIHRKGWRRKRRLWLELSHDMLSSFPSSREEDRIKPIRSILCALLSFHPSHPFPLHTLHTQP